MTQHSDEATKNIGINSAMWVGMGSGFSFGMFYIGTAIALTDGFSNPLKFSDEVLLSVGFVFLTSAVAFLASFAASKGLEKTLGENPSEEQRKQAESRLLCYPAAGVTGSMLILGTSALVIYDKCFSLASDNEITALGNALFILAAVIAVGTLVSTGYALYKTKAENTAQQSLSLT
jgi:hypothetical protein